MKVLKPLNADTSNLCIIIRVQYFKGGAAPIIDTKSSGASNIY